MNLDARKRTSGRHGKQLTLVGCVGDALDSIEKGRSLDVEKLIDHLGQEVPLGRVNMYVNKLKGDRVFTIKAIKIDGVRHGVRIWRIM